MPNLSYNATHEYWSQYSDPMIHRVLTYMESMEDWTLDGDEKLEAALTKLGDALEDIGNIDLQNEAQLIETVTHIKATRTLRLLQALDAAAPGSASKLLSYAEDNSQSTTDTSGLFLRRNIVFERLRLLARLFSPERLSLIQHALEDES